MAATIPARPRRARLQVQSPSPTRRATSRPSTPSSRCVSGRDPEDIRKLVERVRELKRQLGRKTLEVEILEEALAKARAKGPTSLARSPLPGLDGGGSR